MTARRKRPTVSSVMEIREVRAYYTTGPVDKKTVTNPETMTAILREMYDTDHDPQENVFAVYLDSKNSILATELVYRGTVNATTVSVRDILRNALLMNAVCVIIAHNHPSGDPSPSAEDLVFTQRMVNAAKLLGVVMHDHLIIGHGNRYCSLRQRGLT